MALRERGSLAATPFSSGQSTGARRAEIYMGGSVPEKGYSPMACSVTAKFSSSVKP